MKDYYSNTRDTIDKYNEIMNYIRNNTHETTDE